MGILCAFVYVMCMLFAVIDRCIAAGLTWIRNLARKATKQHLAGGIPMTSLPRGQYHAVLFSLLLEYIPTYASLLVHFISL